MNLVYCFSKIAKKPINGKHLLSVDSSIGFLELSPVNTDGVFTSKQGEPQAMEHSVSAKEGLSLTREEFLPSFQAEDTRTVVPVTLRQHGPNVIISHLKEVSHRELAPWYSPYTKPSPNVYAQNQKVLAVHKTSPKRVCSVPPGTSSAHNRIYGVKHIRIHKVPNLGKTDKYI